MSVGEMMTSREPHWLHQGADADRNRQETRFAPWQVAFAGMTAGAPLFAVGGVFVKFLGL
jgi:hypothetical protein